jgi:hypothetical protein
MPDGSAPKVTKRSLTSGKDAMRLISACSLSMMGLVYLPVLTSPEKYLLKILAKIRRQWACPAFVRCVLAPQSVMATRKQFAIIFLGVAMLLGLLISGLGKLRIYDEALGLMGMLVILVAMIKRSENTRALGAALMLAGSVLFVLKVSVPPWLIPGDWLHLGMAFGLILVTPEMLVMRDLPSAQEII